MSNDLWFILLVVAICLVSVCEPVRRWIACAVKWVLGLFGFKDNSKWGVAIKRIWGSCIVILACMLTATAMYEFVVWAGRETGIYNPYRQHKEKVISDNISYFKSYNKKGEIRDKKTGKVLIKNIDWICISEDSDSLAVYVTKNKRGFFNIYTGKVEIPAVYDHAWLYAEGVAAVMKDSSLMFIDRKGEKAFDQEFIMHTGLYDFQFEHGFCMLHDPRNLNVGLINHQGEWVIEPEYNAIEYDDGYWIVTNNDNVYGLYDKDMQMLMPFEYDNIRIGAEGIYAVVNRGTQMLYAFDGKTVLNPLLIKNVDPLYYETENTDNDYGYTMEHATLRYYSSYKRSELKGLISAEGKIVTYPLYQDIEAIGKDLYLCTPQGVILNSKGEVVKQQCTLPYKRESLQME